MTNNNNNNDNDNNKASLSSLHSDYVHHVAFDVYGRRVATCSGDRFVRIWDLAPDGKSWPLSAEWQAHYGSVSCLSWCHPEFGTLVATCGSNQEVKIWEERHKKAWTLRAQLTEARRPVTCLGFAPRHFGTLQLATGSADGVCRIYEAVDLMNLSQWSLQGTMQMLEHGITCLSWCTARFEPPTIVTGASHELRVWRYVSNTREWQSVLRLSCDGGSCLDVAWAPNVGRRFHWIAAAANGLRVFQLTRGDTLELESVRELSSSDHVWRCQWNVTGTVLASSGDGGVVKLWKCDVTGNWQCVTEVHGDLTGQPLQEPTNKQEEEKETVTMQE